MRSWLVIALSALAVSTALASPINEYQAQLRFRIDATRRQQEERYQEMLGQLKALGFQITKDESFNDLLTGTVPAGNANKVTRVPHVQTVLLIPQGYELPGDAEKMLFVQCQLTNRFGVESQRDIADKTRARLKTLGFKEAVGYDHRAHQRLLGWLPRGQLSTLLTEKVQIEVPLPKSPGRAADEGAFVLKSTPIEQTEVLRQPADFEPPKEPAPASQESDYREKISPDLRTLLKGLQGDAQQKPMRVELILRSANDQVTISTVTAPPYSLVLEGELGPLVTGVIQPTQVESLAALPSISTVRLPQSARSFILPPVDSQSLRDLPVDFVSMDRYGPETMDIANVPRKRGPRRVAVVASDFRGHEAFVGNRLPARTQYMDLTGERHPSLQPDPLPGEGVGAGTQIALALMTVVQADELLLVRIDPASSYQVRDIARAIGGESWRSQCMTRRGKEIADQRELLDRRRSELRIERRLALDNFSEDESSVAAKAEYRKRQQQFDEAEAAHAEKQGRYLDFLRKTAQLKGVTAAVLGLHWSDGHPALPGQRGGLRYLDQSLLSSAAWFQVLPRTPDQTWTDLFRDSDQEGAMEFGPTPEGPNLKYLAWHPHPWLRKKSSAEMLWQELPANAVVQLTVQWREIHAPHWVGSAEEDVFRKPIVPLTLLVLRQRDPVGEILPTDAFEVVARSTELPDRLENEPRYAIYELTLRFQVPEKPGRYAIRLEGRAPESTMPAQAHPLPLQERWELYPVLRVETLDPATRQRGRAVFQRMP